MESLQLKLDQLESMIIILTQKIAELETNISLITSNNTYTTSTSVSAQTKGAADIKTGLSPVMGGKVIWNSAELELPPVKTDTPVRDLIDSDTGYNKHNHSRYSGGAIDINTMELVEYERVVQTEEQKTNHTQTNIIDINNNQLNPHCQSHWATAAKIKIDKVPNTNPETKNSSSEDTVTTNVTEIKKIGTVAWIFNPIYQQWGVEAFEIDISKCWFVVKDENGEILKDSNGKEMKSLLYPYKSVETYIDETKTGTKKENVVDTEKTSFIWDTKALIWRLYSVYAEEPIEQDTAISQTGKSVALPYDSTNLQSGEKNPYCKLEKYSVPISSTKETYNADKYIPPKYT